MKTKFFIAFLMVLMVSSCEKYESYIDDFDYTTVYFAYQNPVRTVFSNNLQFDIGVAMGGVRENTSNKTADFVIAPELLADASVVGSNNFTLLPADYYTLSNNEQFVIIKSDFVGKIKVTLNREKFLADPLTTGKTYALPIRITDTSLDSILTGNAGKGIARKDYTIVVVKYISQHHGIYYHRGQRSKYDASNILINTQRYVTEKQEDEYVQNVVWNFKTLKADSIQSSGVGEFYSSSSKNYALNLKILTDNKVQIIGNPSSLIPNVQDLGNSVYDVAKKSFYLNYQYTDVDNMKYIMKDTLTFRNDGLTLELW
ncbi:MAG: DUF1735 domain-containing protein [Paludibacter sp.]|nr:DUF1735 domain-containing protein [Paludibacter sp.]